MDNVPRQPAVATESRFFAETGHSVGQPFVRFLEHYGLTVCGFPVTEVMIENGVKTQYFQNLALEEHRIGEVRLKPLGEAALSAKRRAARSAVREGIPLPDIVDVAASLPRHAARAYPLRTLSDIRYVVIHHSGASGDVGVRAIAGEHVAVNDWPGIGYHYVIAADGTIFKTQDLTAVTHHARQFNPVAVGVALMGDLSSGLPTPEQLASASALVARLVSDLGLPLDSVRGHREMVPTPCPGETFLSVWKPRLMATVGEMLGEPVAAGLTEPVPAGLAEPAAAEVAEPVPVRASYGMAPLTPSSAESPAPEAGAEDDVTEQDALVSNAADDVTEPNPNAFAPDAADDAAEPNALAQDAVVSADVDDSWASGPVDPDVPAESEDHDTSAFGDAAVTSDAEDHDTAALGDAAATADAEDRGTVDPADAAAPADADVSDATDPTDPTDPADPVTPGEASDEAATRYRG